MSENPSFAIKNRYILGLGMWLQGLSLVGRESRERTKFVESISAQVRDNEAMRLEILKKYADKDEDGELKLIEDEDTKEKMYHIDDKELPEFNKEMNNYLDEDFIISGEGNIQRLKIVKSVVLDTQEKIDPKMAVEYDKWCEAFDAVSV